MTQHYQVQGCILRWPLFAGTNFSAFRPYKLNNRFLVQQNQARHKVFFFKLKPPIEEVNFNTTTEQYTTHDSESVAYRSRSTCRLSQATPFSASLQDKPEVLTKFQRIINMQSATEGFAESLLLSTILHVPCTQAVSHGGLCQASTNSLRHDHQYRPLDSRTRVARVHDSSTEMMFQSRRTSTPCINWRDTSFGHDTDRLVSRSHRLLTDYQVQDGYKWRQLRSSVCTCAQGTRPATKGRGRGPETR